jgi:hypothetical protein
MEILNNSIVKLLIRQGTDTDRKNVTLASGELGFTTDQERVFIGNGYTSGGVIVGNKFMGFAPTVTDPSVQPAIVGDFMFSSLSNILFVLSANNGSSASDWKPIGGFYYGSSQILMDTGNIITLKPLSSNSVSNDLLVSPLSVVGGRIKLIPLSAGNIGDSAVSLPLVISSGKISLSPLPSGYISSGAVSYPLSVLPGGMLGLAPLSSYSISQEALSSPLIVRDGRVTLTPLPTHLVSSKTITIGNGLEAIVNGSTSDGLNISPISNDIIINSNQILLRYNALSGSGSYARNVLSYSTLSTGHYYVTWQYKGSTFFPMASIIGNDALGYEARIISTGLSSCDIKILDLSGNTRDANIVLTISF